MTTKTQFRIQEEPILIPSRQIPLGFYFSVLGIAVAVLFSFALISAINDKIVVMRQLVSQMEFNNAAVVIDVASLKDFKSQFKNEIKLDYEMKPVLKTRYVAHWSASK